MEDGLIGTNLGSGSSGYIYVSKKFSESELRARANYFSSILRAIDFAADGDTVFVIDGDYAEKIQMKEGVHLIGAGVEFASLYNDQAELTSEPLVLFKDITKGELSGFLLRGPASEPNFDNLVSVQNSSVTLSKNRFKIFRFGLEGVGISGNSKAELFDNYFENAGLNVNYSECDIHDNDFFPTANYSINASHSKVMIKNNFISPDIGIIALSIKNSSGDISNNEIQSDNASAGVVIFESSDINLFNNVIRGSIYFDALKVANSTDVKIVNNVFHSSKRGVNVENSAGEFYNNIITGNSEYGIMLPNTFQFDYNNLWNETNYFWCEAASNDLSADPSFADLNNYNYKLTENSPCLNSGNPGSIYKDLDGSRNDIGLFGGPFVDTLWWQNRGVEITVDSVSAGMNDTVSVPIYCKNIKGTRLINLTICSDDKLVSPIDVDLTSLTNNFNLSKSLINEKTVAIKFEGRIPMEQKEGVICKINYAVKRSAGKNSAITISNAGFTNMVSKNLPIKNIQNGAIRIIPTSVENGSQVPTMFKLYQNYPNPFNPSTNIKFEIPKESKVSLKIYNILGEEVSVLADKIMKVGQYNYVWNAINYASGVYLIRLETDYNSSVKKIILLK